MRKLANCSLASIVESGYPGMGRSELSSDSIDSAASTSLEFSFNFALESTVLELEQQHHHLNLEKHVVYDDGNRNVLCNFFSKIFSSLHLWSSWIKHESLLIFSNLVRMHYQTHQFMQILLLLLIEQNRTCNWELVLSFRINTNVDK